MDLIALCLGASGQVQHKPSLAMAQGQLHGVGQTPADALLVHQPVHHQIDGVLPVLFQRGDSIQRMEPAIDAHARKAFGPELFQQVLMRALLQFHQRGKHQEFLALRQPENVRDDLVRGAGLDGTAAPGAPGGAEAGKKDTQKVIDLRDRAHRGTRIPGHALLLQRNGR